MYWNTKTCKKMGLLCFLIVMITVSFSLNATAKNKISVSVNGKRAIIMDMETEEVLYGKNIKKKCENASTTKLLTAITAEDRTSLSKKVRIYRVFSSQTGQKPDAPFGSAQKELFRCSLTAEKLFLFLYSFAFCKYSFYCSSSRTISSMCIPRDPFTRTVSPGRSCFFRIPMACPLFSQ